MRNRLGPLRSKSERKADSRNLLDSSREMAACSKLKAFWPWMSARSISSSRPWLLHLFVERSAGNRACRA